MLTHGQIKHMVERFLAWKLPEDFHPDGGISVIKVGNPGTPHEYRLEPTGTNLLDYLQAYEMICHLADGLPSAAPEPEDRAPIPDRSALGPHGDEEPVHRLDLPPPTPAMEAKASEIARRYGGGAIPHHAALAGLIEGQALPPAIARPNRTSWGLEGPTRAEVDDVLETARLMPLDPLGGFTAPDPKNYRTAAREVVEGFEVAAYRETDPVHGDRYGHRYSEHWSTPNWKHPDVKVERLFTEAQLRAALEQEPGA